MVLFSVDDRVLLSMSLFVLFASLWFLFSVYNGRGMQIQGQLGLLTFTRVG